MGDIYGHGGHLDLQTMTICINFQSPFNTRLHMKFEEISPRGFRGEVVQMCEWTDERTDDGRGVITIAHPKGGLKRQEILLAASGLADCIHLPYS